MNTREHQVSHYEKVKQLKFVNILILFILFVIPGVSKSQALVEVLGAPNIVNVNSGDDFSIVIQLDATGANVTVADIYMTFDPSVVHVNSTSFAVGSPLSISTFPSQAPDNVAGTWAKGGFGFTPVTTLIDYILVECTAVGSGTTLMEFVEEGFLSTTLAFAGFDVTGQVNPIEINVTSITVDCPAFGVNNGDPCFANTEPGAYLNCECLPYDCNGVVGGTASIDECGVCSGGSTGLIPNVSCEDCAGVANGDVLPGSQCYNGVEAGIYDADCNCISNPLGSIFGHVDWISECGSRSITVELSDRSFSALNEVYVTEIDANGDFVTPALSTGIYDILITVEGYLAQLYSNLEIEAGVNEIYITGIIAGDLNHSNGVNISDVSIVAAAFSSVEEDSNYNFLADFNCDGTVNIIDVSILNATFALVGDSLPVD